MVAQKLRDFSQTLKSHQFETLSPIGSTEFGAVYRMRHKSTQNIYAIKRIDLFGK